MASYSPKNQRRLLSERQKEILELIYRGHLGKEIAHLLHISIKTVEYHRAQLMQRLGAQTQADLVRRAIEQGIVAGRDTLHSDRNEAVSADVVPGRIWQSTEARPRLEDAALGDRFRSALAGFPVIAFNQDKQLRYTWIHSPVLYWAATECIGRTDMDIVGGKDGERLTAIKQVVLETGVGTRTDAAVTFNDKTHYFDLVVNPLRNDDGSIEGITCACTDITARKRALTEREKLIEQLANARDELAQKNTELEAVNKEKAIWLAMAAHDLRNLLSAVVLDCHSLISEWASASEQMPAFQGVQSSTEAMFELLDGLLDVSEIETGKQALHRQPTGISSLIEDSIALFRDLAIRKGIHVEARYPQHIPAIRLDRQKMTRVLLNLIGNSIKFGRNGSVVRIEVMLSPANLVISMQDNGLEILPDEVESIFLPFQRGHIASVQPGKGLGLAICKKIVDGHGGHIWAESRAGGAVFYLSLPFSTTGS